MSRLLYNLTRLVRTTKVLAILDLLTFGISFLVAFMTSELDYNGKFIYLGCVLGKV